MDQPGASDSEAVAPAPATKKPEASSQSDQSQAERRRQPKAHWCEQCQKSFERADHYARHLHSHEDRRPYRCPWCPKGFNRGDLLYRHKQMHTRKGDIRCKAARASRACRSCVQTKSKCTDVKPCPRCVRRGIPCEPVQTDPQTPKKNHSAVEAELPPSSSLFTPNSSERHAPSPRPHSELDLHPVPEPGPLPIEQDGAVYDPPPMQNMDTTVFMDPGLITSHGNNSFTDAFLFTPGGSDWDSNCFDLDLETLQMLSGPALLDPGLYSGDNLYDAGHPSPASSRFEVFKRSPWLWTPVRIDHAYAGQESLEMDETDVDPSLCVQNRHFQAALSPQPLDRACRDKILYMIFSTSKSGISPYSFPSSSFLDRMMQVHFGWSTSQSTSWIHAPSFDPALATPELLGVIVAAGASLVSIPKVWKMAYALQERSRLALSASIESDNSRVLELQTIEAYLLWVSMGLWSGFKRNMEVAESFLAAPITMLRRRGAFSRQPYVFQIHTHPSEGVETLDNKWYQWIKQESLKRTAIFSIITDIRCSMAYLRPPNCSVTELSCPLPASRDVWLAPTSVTWRDALLSKGTFPESSDLPSWLSIMQDTRLLHGLQPFCDMSLVSLVIAYGFWPQIWAYHECQRMARVGPLSQTVTRLSLTVLHQEIARHLESAKRTMAKYALDTSEFQIVCEFCLMALNVSPRELQLFAGRLGEEEAETTQHLLRQWMMGPEFKAGVWHAGQVLRIARTAPPTQLREFLAIAVYQSSLTLWAYGLLSRTLQNTNPVPVPVPAPVPAPGDFQTDNNNNNTTTGVTQVFLDGPECPETVAFVAAGEGQPGIALGAGQGQVFCPLAEIGTVMKAACTIYRENFGLENAPLPPLLESLISLMTDLGNIDVDSFALPSRGLSMSIGG